MRELGPGLRFALAMFVPVFVAIHVRRSFTGVSVWTGGPGIRLARVVLVGDSRPEPWQPAARQAWVASSVT